MKPQALRTITDISNKLAVRVLCGGAAVAALPLLLAACAPTPPPDPTAAPYVQPATPTSGVSATSTALWPDGKPVANMPMVFYFGTGAGDYKDLATDAAGNFPTPDYTSCGSVCELWIGVASTRANMDAFQQRTGIGSDEKNCLLPLSASPNPQTWQDIQLSSSSPATLSVPETDCDDSSTFEPGSWHQGFAISQSKPGLWLTARDFEQFVGTGSLDQSTPLGDGTFPG